MIDTDVLVIGSGLAGLMAASKAAEEGVDVVVVDKGSGASYQSSGVIDVMALPPGGVLTLKPLEGIARTIENSSMHPYSVIASGWDLASIVRQAVNHLKKLVSDGVKIEGELDENVILLNTLGGFKVTCLYQATMRSGVLSRLKDASLLVVGFNGLVGFNPRFCASSFKHFASNFNIETVKAAGVKLAIPSLKNINLTAVELARMMDEEEFRKEIVRELGETASGDITHVALPTLGLKNAHENMKWLEEETGLNVFELVSPPPSIPGQRLMMAFEEEATRRGVRVFRGYRAVGFESEGDHVTAVVLESGNKKFLARAHAFILATGKFIGGGIVEEKDEVKEAVFNLPLYDENGKPLRGRRIAQLLTRKPFPREGHPLMGCGVKVSPSMAPLSEGGAIYDNLFVAGSLISGYNYVREKSGMGIAATTGYIAGLSAASCVK